MRLNKVKNLALSSLMITEEKKYDYPSASIAEIIEQSCARRTTILQQISMISKFTGIVESTICLKQSAKFFMELKIAYPTMVKGFVGTHEQVIKKINQSTKHRQIHSLLQTMTDLFDLSSVGQEQADSQKNALLETFIQLVETNQFNSVLSSYVDSFSSLTLCVR